MNIKELKEALSKFPDDDDREVRIIQHASCCCGDCFLAADGESDPWRVIDLKEYVLIE